LSTIQNKDSLTVLSLYKNGNYEPKKLKWRGTSYTIESVNLRYPKRKGEQLFWYFDVSDSRNYWKLAFNTETLQWHVENFYSE